MNNFPVDENITTKIEKSYQELENEVNQRFISIDRNDARTIHKLRLSLKKFRYIDEVTQKLYKRKPKLKKIKDLQDTMGKIQDISVLQKSIKNYIKSNKNVKDDEILKYYTEIENEKEEQIDEMMIQIRKNLNFE